MSNNPSRTNASLIEIIKRPKIDVDYIYDGEQLLDEKVQYLATHCKRVLDFGKSSRKRFDVFSQTQIVTTDINQYEDYPDIIDDICDIQTLKQGDYDGIICMSVLEHVYAPDKAVQNIHSLLKENGYCLLHVPYLWRYHASPDLMQQDYYRFSRDGLAYLFRDFSDVTIYPVRGTYSTIFNLFGFWKYKIDKPFGQGINKLIDTVFGFILRDRQNILQASGYYLWARK